MNNTKIFGKSEFDSDKLIAALNTRGTDVSLSVYLPFTCVARIQWACGMIQIMECHKRRQLHNIDNLKQNEARSTTAESTKGVN